MLCFVDTMMFIDLLCMHVLQVAAKKLRTRLSQLGAKSIIVIGLGDDQDSSGYVVSIYCLYLLSLLFICMLLGRQILYLSCLSKFQGLFFFLLESNPS